MREATIAATAVLAFLDFATRRGADRAELLRGSRLQEETLEDRDARVLLQCYHDLVQIAKRLTRDPALALHYGEAIDVNDITLAPALAAASSTIAEVFATLNQYSRLGVDVDAEGGGGRFEVANAAGLLWLIDRRMNPNSFPELTESTFAQMVCSTRRRFGHLPLFKTVHVTHAAPAHADAYERVFQIPVVFASDRNALALDEALINGVRGQGLSPLMVAVLRERADVLLARLDTAVTTRQRVESVLYARLSAGNASVEMVARELAMSRQTLFRRLKSEGVLHHANGQEASAHHIVAAHPIGHVKATPMWIGRRLASMVSSHHTRRTECPKNSGPALL